MSQPMQVLTSSESNEWYTPPWIIKLVRDCMGSIDLDPASCQYAQRHIVRAHQWFGLDNQLVTDGLLENWYGRIWLNPPYGRTKNASNAGIWATKLQQEYAAGHVHEAIMLINSAHGYEWYENLWRRWPVVCVRDRIRFVNEQGLIGGQSKKAQTIIYFGRNVMRFSRLFSYLGRFLLPDVQE